jgi:ATP-dependent DNA helicase RecG
MTPDALLPAIFRLNLAQSRGLERLGLETAADLLRYFPRGYGANLPVKTIAELTKGETVTVYGQVTAAKTSRAFRKRMPLGEITLADQSGKIKAIWFHQPYLAKKVPVGQPARLSGKVTERADSLYFANPEIETTSGSQAAGPLFADEAAGETYLLPTYPETQGLSSSWFHHAIKRLLAAGLAAELEDPLPPALLAKYHLPALATALVWIHEPKTLNAATAARKRFAFEEIFFIQLERLRAKRDYQKNGAFAINLNPADLETFTNRFDFHLTGAQQHAIYQITRDLAGEQAMTRLLEGDVGSGKTAVAAATAFAVVRAGFEVAYLVPTEILARQHFASFIHYFSHLPIQIALLTGSECRKFPSKINPADSTTISRPQLLKWVANGEIPILIGTHALIQDKVKFKNLAYVIIDEQHRFGVRQRSRLVAKQAGGGRTPHLLSMTATPIPRTLALTLYGDLDLSLLDELPAGRRPIKTEIVPENERGAAYQKIRAELKNGRQAYVICPRIDEPDPTKELALNVKSAKAEAGRLATEIFPDFRVDLVHSKLKPTEKEKVMADFAAGKIDILVATSVVEVGVNVPNATLIIIEGAERFGLAQLHQLRGRVLRSAHQAYCYLFTTSGGPSNKRLHALQTAKNGFELAEQDLALRGPGALVGTKQWGISDVGMEAIKNLKMVEAARLEAQAIMATDPDLKNYPRLAAKLREAKQAIHFE